MPARCIGPAIGRGTRGWPGGSATASASQLDGLTFDNARASGRLGLSALHGIYQQLLAFPDEVWPWMFEYAAIERIARGAGVAAIVSSSPPATTHLIAARLAEVLAACHGLRTFAIRGPSGRPADASRHSIASSAGSSGAHSHGAHTLVTVSDPIARDLERLHAKPTEVAGQWIRSRGRRGHRRACRLPLRPGRFTILHTGTLAHDTHDPSPFFTRSSAPRSNHSRPSAGTCGSSAATSTSGAARSPRFPRCRGLVHLQPLVPATCRARGAARGDRASHPRLRRAAARRPHDREGLRISGRTTADSRVCHARRRTRLPAARNRRRGRGDERRGGLRGAATLGARIRRDRHGGVERRTQMLSPATIAGRSPGDGPRCSTP